VKGHRSPKIHVLEGPAPGRDFPLRGDFCTVGRSDPRSGWKPEVDLSPDRKVSRRHCRLFRSGDDWWIEDLGSRHGTRVEDLEIRRMGKPVRVRWGTPVRTGDTRWVLDPPGKVRKEWHGLTVEYTRVPAINYALYHCGIPILSDFTLANPGPSPSPALELSITIRGYSECWRKRIDPVPPGGTIELRDIHLPLHYDRLEGHEGRKRARFGLSMNGEEVVREEIPILGFYEWPTDPRFRMCLACFVQPSHPRVQNIVLDANDSLEAIRPFSSMARLLRSEEKNRVEIAMHALYRCLREAYRIHYLPYSVGYEATSQRIRPPHRVLPGSGEKRGGGTCIDLVLLFAACLENLHLQPLIVVVSEDSGARRSGQHALLGCWRRVSERFEPIRTDFERLRRCVGAGGEEQLILLETTGLSDRFGERLSFEEARSKAEEQFRRETFRFAVDVAAARQTVPPLQLPMDPGALEALRTAERMAREEGNPKLETRHLLRSLIRTSDLFIETNLEEAGAALSSMRTIVSGWFRGPSIRPNVCPRPTLNYRRVIMDAMWIVSDIGQDYIGKVHLWYAILLSRSEQLGPLFERLGVDRDEVKATFARLVTWTRGVVQTLAERHDEVE